MAIIPAIRKKEDGFTVHDKRTADPGNALINPREMTSQVEAVA